MKNPNVELIELLFKTARLMKQEMSFTNNLMHLSVLQIHALIFLKHNDNVTMSDIADYFKIELPSATNLINILCDQKLVKRYENPEDRRLVMITLTYGGKKLLKQVISERKKKLEKVLSYLSDQDKTALFKIFKTLYNKLQK
ncbi:MarR family transcriptional regulator [Patescibacteria group bacterium]|nr:MarR family transcriptional regulator [Patescibacteria group bacterium]